MAEDARSIVEHSTNDVTRPVVDGDGLVMLPRDIDFEKQVLPVIIECLQGRDTPGAKLALGWALWKQSLVNNYLSRRRTVSGG